MRPDKLNAVANPALHRVLAAPNCWTCWPTGSGHLSNRVKVAVNVSTNPRVRGRVKAADERGRKLR